MLVVFLLGFSSGLPITILSSLLPSWFKTSGLNIVSIGCLSLLGQPYAYKFLWAPLLDHFGSPIFKSLDHRRSWILSTQLWIILMIILMVFFNPQTNPLLLGILGFLLAVGSATQDIVIDAYKIDILSPDERALGLALAVEGYRVAMIISGSFGLILAERYGWQKTYLIMAILMLIGIITTAKIAPSVPITNKKNPFNLKNIVWQPLKNFLQKDQAYWLLLLMVLYKIGDVCSHSLVTPFLLDLNFTLTEVGTINKLVSVVGSLIGVMCAGIIMTRISLFKALLFFGCLQSISNLLYLALALVGKNYYIAIGAFFIENLCSGMGNGALVALLMSLCSSQYSATQYALFSSLTALSRVYIGPFAGLLVKSLGWHWFYLISATLAIPGLILIFFLKSQIMLHDRKKATTTL